MDGTVHAASDRARERLLAALGHDVADDAAAGRSLAALEAVDRERPVDPARVVGVGDAAAVPLRVADAPGAAVEWRVVARREDGTTHAASGRATLDRDGLGVAPLGGGGEDREAAGLPVGYHALDVTVWGPFGRRSGEQALVVAPPRCADPAVVLRGERAAGITANLYAVRGRRNWGAGDLTDLHALAELAAANGAAFVGVNPLHALRTDGAEPSPYSPASRRYRHLLYLDVEAVPELADDAAARALLADPAHAAAVAELRGRDQVDHRGVLAAKRPALDALHRAFRARPAGDARRRAFDAYAAREGAALDRWALFAALDEHFRGRGVAGGPSGPPSCTTRAARRRGRSRPSTRRPSTSTAGRSSSSTASSRRRRRGAGRWACPWGCTRTSPWARRRRGGRVGGPGAVRARREHRRAARPVRPGRAELGAAAVEPARAGRARLPRLGRARAAGMAHAGALRIDHAIGLFRQFWIADGLSGRGRRLRALPVRGDARRARAGERARQRRGGGARGGRGPGHGAARGAAGARALGGAVEPGAVLRARRGRGVHAAARYPRPALATVNTHDLAPLAGWWAGRDVELRHAVGLLDGDGLAAARVERAGERASLVRMLHDEGVLDASAVGAGGAAGADGAAEDPGLPGGVGPDGAGGPGAPAHEGAHGRAPRLLPAALDAGALDGAVVCRAVHMAMRRAPSWLVGLALEDLVGEPDPVNMPGVGGDRFSSWTRRLRVNVEDLAAHPAVARAFGAERVIVGAPGVAAAHES
jgi:4-alpha-glucanotransferase